MTWMPIETAPKDGTPVDLWIEGADNVVDFYTPLATKVPGQPKRHGRLPDVRWMHKKPNAPNWYAIGGLGMSLSPEVTPTHWMRPPQPPESS